MTNEMTLTYQTRLNLDERQEKIVQNYASLLSSVERSLFAEVSKGKISTSCKSDFLKKFGITARQFNGCRINLDGKIAACKTAQQQHLISLKQQIASLDTQIKKLETKTSKKDQLHQKKRRKHILEFRLSSIEEDKKQKKIRLCFGGKRLFNAQYYLEENRFASHSEWEKIWKAKRNSEFFLVGSKDETGGNQTCSAYVKNEKINLHLRIPKALENEFGKYIEIENLFFNYGQKDILAALNHPEGRALSYRFKKDDKGWKVFVSVAIEKPVPVCKNNIGVIGIDLNADHIAYVETDCFGNIISKKRMPWISYGKKREQLKAITGDLCKTIIEKAKETKKPIVIEQLDFQRKKLSLKEGKNKKFARLLSSFAYGLFIMCLKGRAFKHGIEVNQVNPAFTSVIGRVNYAKRYGLSVHLAAALCIARRYQKFSETPCSPIAVMSDGKGSHVTFVLPERNRTEHVWRFWGHVKKKITTVLAAHKQTTLCRSNSPLKTALGIGDF